MGCSASNSNISLELEEVKRLIKSIQISCQKLDNKQVQKQVQEEISRIVVLLQKVEKLILRTSKRKLIQRELSILVDFLELAADSLLQTVPNIHFAETIITDVERVIYRYEYPVLVGFTINRFIDAYRSPSTSLKVIFGLISATFLYGTITLGLISSLGVYLLWYSNFNDTGKEISKLKKEITKINIIQEQKQSSLSKAAKTTVSIPVTDSAAITSSTITPSLSSQEQKLSELKNIQYSEVGKHIEFYRQLVWAISAGTLGSIISILIRIEEFQGKRYSDKIVPFLTGLLKPIIGASFGILFFTLINSQLVVISGISDKEAGSKKEFLIFAICFIAGFSERLARDAIDRAENMIGGSQATIQSKQTSALLKDTPDGLTVQQTTQENNLQLKQEANSTTSDAEVEVMKKN